MRGSHLAVIVGGCAVIVTAGFAAAPPLNPTKAVAEPEPTTAPTSSATAEQTVEPEPTPEPTATATTGATDAPAEEPAEEPAAEPETFAGPPISNPRGTYQAQITVVDGVVTDVIALEAGTSAPESVRVNSEAIPALAAQVLEAQTWDVDAISGASFTSPAFIESLHGAFDEAGLS